MTSVRGEKNKLKISIAHYKYHLLKVLIISPGSRRPDCASNQDSSLIRGRSRKSIRDRPIWAQKLPCLGTGRLELTARGHSNSGTVTGTFQILS